MAELFTPDDLVNELRDYVRDAGSQKAAAAELGFSASYINDVLQGYRPVADGLAASLGFRTVRLFESTKQSN